jgi:tRNA dimethylallyltransferase
VEQGDSADQRLPVILLAGPTGVGKTELSLRLAERFRTEIVNADSMQVYRYMDIGTAKPTQEERARVRHHLLDLVDPDEPFDAGSYLTQAQPVVAALHARGAVPLVVGGTGLYLKVLSHGICDVAPGDAGVRERLQHELQLRGLAHLYRELQRVDPVLGERVQPRDRQRILRALEVYAATGKPLSAWQADHGFRQSRYRTIKVFVTRSREDLYKRIDQRVQAMLAQGFLEEVRGLLERGYGADLKAMQSLGYRQLTAHLGGECSLDEAVQLIQRDTRRYAKRQLTWFRADAQYLWLAADDEQRVIQHLEQCLSGESGPAVR